MVYFYKAHLLNCVCVCVSVRPCICVCAYEIFVYNFDLRYLFLCDTWYCEIFLFTPWQMKEESFLEDINSLLNSGEVPNIFTADEKEDLCEKMGQLDKQRDKSLQVRIFLIILIHFTVKRYLHYKNRVLEL